MLEGLRRLKERSQLLMSGKAVPAIEGERVRENYYGWKQPGIIHWKSIDMVSHTRKTGRRRSKKETLAPISKDRSQI